MADVELLPCPFCGNPAHLNTIRTSDQEFIRLNGRDTGYGVNCERCGVNNRGFAYGWATVEKAVEHWNTRANVETATAKLRAEVERVNSWNASVSVCRDHVADIVDGPCVICALDAAEARAERLAEALRHYGQHDETCGVLVFGQIRCTCGFSAAIQDQEDRNG